MNTVNTKVNMQEISDLADSLMDMHKRLVKFKETLKEDLEKAKVNKTDKEIEKLLMYFLMAMQDSKTIGDVLGLVVRYAKLADKLEATDGFSIMRAKDTTMFAVLTPEEVDEFVEIKGFAENCIVIKNNPLFNLPEEDFGKRIILSQISWIKANQSETNHVNLDFDEELDNDEASEEKCADCPEKDECDKFKALQQN